MEDYDDLKQKELRELRQEVRFVRVQTERKMLGIAAAAMIVTCDELSTEQAQALHRALSAAADKLNAPESEMARTLADTLKVLLGFEEDA